MARSLLTDAWIQTWQIVAMIAVVWGVSRWMEHRRTYVTYLMWLAVTIRCLIPCVRRAQQASFAGYQHGFICPSVRYPVNSIILTLREKRRPFTRLSPSRLGVQAASATERNGATLTENIDNLTDVPRTRDATSFDVASVRSLPLNWHFVLLSSWCLGCGIVLATGILRTWILTKQLGGKRHETPASLLQLVNDLSHRLGVKSQVTIWVTDNAGPAVFGVVRPKLILPQAMTEPFTPACQRSLEIVLTHELLHVRRHDLKIGLLQFATQVIWWFNPCVWWASRSLSEAIELCCDQETIAHLRCQPVEYARCLLRIVEQQRSLPRMPALRSITPTGRRLKYIVHLSKECPMRNMPRSRWLCLFLILVLFWPARPVLNGQQELPVANDLGPVGDLKNGPKSAVELAVDEATTTPSTAESSRAPELAEQQVVNTGDEEKETPATIVLPDDHDSASLLRQDDAPSRFRDVTLEECITSVLHQKADFSPTAGGVDRGRTTESIVVPPIGAVARKRLHHVINEVEFAYFNLAHRYCVLTAAKDARDATLDLWKQVASDAVQETSQFEADLREHIFSSEIA